MYMYVYILLSQFYECHTITHHCIHIHYPDHSSSSLATLSLPYFIYISQHIVLGDITPVEKNNKMRDFSNQNSSISVNRTDPGSPSVKILLGLLDVIRCGIQRYSVFRILKTMEENICDFLNLEMKYDYFPAKIEEKKSEKVNKTETQANTTMKIRTEIKSEPKSDAEETNEEEDDKEEKDNEHENENEKNVKKVMSSTVDEKVMIKEEIQNEEEMKNNEENNRKKISELEKIEKIEKEKDLQIIREKRTIFLKEFLSSDKAVFLVTLPDSFLLITASPRYGFELKSVVCNEEPNPFSHFLQIQNGNYNDNNTGDSNKNSNSNSNSNSRNIKSESIAIVTEIEKSGDASSSTHKTTKKNDTKHTTPCKYRPCESLFHPMSARVDLTQQLVRSLKSVILGSHLRYDWNRVKM